MFAATTPKNTLMAYHASTSANPNPVISPAFVEANYEALESLLRDQRESRVERNTKGGRPLEEAPKGNAGQSVNLLPLLAAHLRRSKNGQPLQSSLTSAYGGQALPNNIGGNLHSNDSFERSKKSSWDNNRGQKNKDRFSPYRGSNHGLLPSLSKSTKEILATEKVARSFEPPPKMFKSKRSRDMSKYYHFHKDYGHDTNDCRHFRTQIQEAVNSGQLSHLVKGIKKERTKSFDTPQGESKKDKGTTLAEVPLLMVNNAPVIIEAKIFGRNVERVYMDSGSSCEIIYEYCFEKLNPTIKATKVDLKTPLVGFSRECSWSIGEVPLEITIGDAPLSRIETLNFVIVRSESSHNMLLGTTAMQRVGIVVSTIHGAIKFHTKKGIRTVLSADETDEGMKRTRKILATNEERVLSCVNAEENFYRTPRTIMVEGKPFNMEHMLNEYSHVKPIKQNKRGLGPDHNMAACKETKELTKAGILQKVMHQTWVANPIMVKKSDRGWRIAYQIQIAKEDEDKTAFYAGEGVFCYKKMSFGLKNAWATYQRLVDKGIKANPSKVKAVTDLDQAKTLKDIQSLNGKLAALSRFLLKGAKISLAFFKGPTRSRTQLSCLGEACTGLGLRSKKTPKILSGPHDKREYDIVLLRRNEKETLVKIPFEDNEKKEKPKEVPDLNSNWRLYTDGASNSDGSGAGIMLIDPEGKEYTYALRFEFKTTNNEAKYEALLAGASKSTQLSIRRNQDNKADVLSKLASMTFEHLTKEVLVEVLTKRSIEEKEVLKVDIQERKSWMDTIHEYMLSGLLAEDTKKARNIIIQAPQYKLIRGNLYKRSFFTPWLRCVASPQTDKIIKEIHEGSCGFNAKPGLLVVRITKKIRSTPYNQLKRRETFQRRDVRRPL
ncbi:reverse transcriptase domain-containing protein [Tanacetum coccineum]